MAEPEANEQSPTFNALLRSRLLRRRAEQSPPLRQQEREQREARREAQAREAAQRTADEGG